MGHYLLESGDIFEMPSIHDYKATRALSCMHTNAKKQLEGQYNICDYDVYLAYLLIPKMPYLFFLKEAGRYPCGRRYNGSSRG